MDEIENRAAGAGRSRDPLHGPKRQRMVGDHQISPLPHRLGHHLRGEREAGHHPVDLIAVRGDEQTDRVPVGGEPQGREVLEGGGHDSERRHTKKILW